MGGLTHFIAVFLIYNIPVKVDFFNANSVSSLLGLNGLILTLNLE
ncbi:MAG: hypothetical protein ACTSXU_04740 [Promethearchaeota archaeon]